jgi:hypothetical protein
MLPRMSQKQSRVRRRRSTERPGRTPRIVRATGPADLLRFVPDLLPVDPEDSLVLVLFRRSTGTRSRTHGAMRVDLRHTEAQEELDEWAAAVLGQVLRVDGVTGVAIAAYTPETFAPTGRAPAAAQVRAVARHAAAMGLEVLDRFVVAADGWGSLDGPRLARGGQPLALLDPDEPRAPRPAPLAAPEPAPDAQADRFADQFESWWSRPEGPGGVLHGVTLGDAAAVPSRASGPASMTSLLQLPTEESAMDRYRWGRDIDAVVDLVEGILEPHEEHDRPCACRALLLALVVRQGLIGLLLSQIAWGPGFGREVWTAVSAPAGRARSMERMLAAIGGGPFRRPDTDRIEAAIAALHEVETYVDTRRTGAAIDEALCWLHWARGGSSAAGALAARALERHDDRDIAPIVLAKAQRGVLPQWAFRTDPTKPDRYEALLARRTSA